MTAAGQPSRGPVIAIDGPSGTGKSTIARALARRLGCRYIDTGAMYRAAALVARRRGVSADDPAALVRALEDFPIDYAQEAGQLKVLLGGEDITEAVRLPGVGDEASRLSRFPEVRSLLLEKQRALAREGSVVMEGRDIGTVVLPGADLKIFLDAEEQVRIDRRLRQWREKGIEVSAEELAREVRDRDRRDRSRAEAPLAQAGDAFRVDTSRKSAEEVEREILRLLGGKRS